MKRKVVTVCGSLRFLGKIQEVSERLELEKGWVVLGVVPHVLERALTEEEKALLGQVHLEKIDLSDAVYVVNPGGYIGAAVQNEIRYAQSRGKEIFYLEESAQGC